MKYHIVTILIIVLSDGFGYPQGDAQGECDFCKIAKISFPFVNINTTYLHINYNYTNFVPNWQYQRSNLLLHNRLPPERTRTCYSFLIQFQGQRELFREICFLVGWFRMRLEFFYKFTEDWAALLKMCTRLLAKILFNKQHLLFRRFLSSIFCWWCFWRPRQFLNRLIYCRGELEKIYSITFVDLNDRASIAKLTVRLACCNSCFQTWKSLLH
jgi:hypothetical protein